MSGKPKHVKIISRKNYKPNMDNLNTTNNIDNIGGAETEDIVENDEFDENISDEGIVEEQTEEEDTLENEDYGDEEQKDIVEDQEQEIEYEQEGESACLYKFAKNLSESEDEDENMILEDELENKKNNLIVDNNERETKPILTKYERVRILGDRAKQLSLGAKPMLLNVENMNPKDIAILELDRGVIPFIIEKVLPDGRRERWKINELKIIN